jgi:hypothetical protein
VAGVFVAGASVGWVPEGDGSVEGVPRVGTLGVVLLWVDVLGDVVPVEAGDGVRGVAEAPSDG